MSQTELALTADVPRPYVSQIEAGKRDVGLEILQRLAAALDVDAMDLLRPDKPKRKRRKKILTKTNRKLAKRSRRT